jgi:hypothetical protein
MKVTLFKTDSDLEQRVQQVEALMDHLGLTIESGTVRHGAGICIRDRKTNATYRLIDTESRDTIQEFPRMIDNIRIEAE